MLTGRIKDRILSDNRAEAGRKAGIYFYFREIASELGTEVLMKDGRKLLMLGSNSYMGLTTHPEVKAAAAEALAAYGTGCAGSRFLNGTLDLHIALENELARWVNKEAALVFSTGFQVNQGVMAALLNRHDYVLMDMNNHASIVDGARLAMARPVRFAHNDPDHLERILKRDIPPDKGKMIVVDGVFSMEGDIICLPQIAELARVYECVLMVDDAHGLGVLGENGGGTAEHFGLTDATDLIMGTFSKSLASIGGFIAADHRTIDFIKHHARSFIFSASLPAASTAAALAALRIIRREPERRERLFENTHMMREGLRALGFDTGVSTTPVIPVHIGAFDVLMQICRFLDEAGIFVNPVISPAVLPEQCLLRVSLMATHTRAQIESALEVFARVARRFRWPGHQG
jgi:8-amino-7-oxononanoate synthase